MHIVLPGGPLVILVVALLLVAAAAQPAQAQVASWLDEAPHSWNAAGGAVPAAPAPDSAIRAPCRARERAPASFEEQQVAQAGWRLNDFWPAQRAGDLTLVLATATYDGMCRPWAFNGFAFAGGRFAGTLSPFPMNARADGVLSGTPSLLPDGFVEARFLRYAPTDALCCPSRPATSVVYRVARDAGGPSLVPQRIVVATGAPAGVQLPRTGRPGAPRSAALAQDAPDLLAGKPLAGGELDPAAGQARRSLILAGVLGLAGAALRLQAAARRRATRRPAACPRQRSHAAGLTRAALGRAAAR